ncbi:MAG: PAS domain S-box protein [Gemmatimonadota bacterium]|nr:PAS domain S-box protein [Gemmatimonadota bacterium]
MPERSGVRGRLARTPLRRLVLAGMVAAGLYSAALAVYVSFVVAPQFRAVAARTTQLRFAFEELTEGARDMSEALVRVEALREAADPRDAESIEQAAALARERLEDVDPVHTALALEDVNPRLREALARAADLEAQLASVLLEIARRGATDELPAADRLAEARRLARLFETEIRVAQALGFEDLARRQATMAERAEGLRRVLLGWLAGGIMALVLAAAAIGRRVYGPLARLDRALEEVAAGQLDVRVPVRYADEFGRVTVRLNEAIAILDEQARRQRREARNVSRRLSRILGEAFDEVYVLSDDPPRVLEVSAGALANLGCRRETVEGGSPVAFLPEFDEGSLDRLLARLRDGVAESILLTTRCRRCDGTEYPVEMRLQYSREESPPVFLAIARDIGRLRESEERYRHLFESIPLPAVVFAEGSLKLLAVNRAAERTYGWSRDELLQRTVSDLFAPGEAIAFLAETGGAGGLGTEAGRDVRTWRHRTRNGEEMDVEVHEYPLAFRDQPARLVVMRDVTRRLRIERQLRASERQMRRFSAHLQNVREEERKAISREIHDELGQVLTRVRMDLLHVASGVAGDEPAAREIRAGLDAASTRVSEAIATVRRIASELRPGVLDKLGLVPALEWLVSDFAQRSGVEARFVSDLDRQPIETDRATHVFRIAQEALTNVQRHARASSVRVELARVDGHIVLRIADDGRGFEIGSSPETGLGLVGIGERAELLGGGMHVETGSDAGTRLEVRFPARPEAVT